MALTCGAQKQKISLQPSALNSGKAEPKAGFELETNKRTIAQLMETRRPRQQHELCVSIRLEDVSLEASVHISSRWALKSGQIVQIRPRLFQTVSIRSALHHRMMLQKVKTNPQPLFLNGSLCLRPRHVPPSDTREVGEQGRSERSEEEKPGGG